MNIPIQNFQSKVAHSTAPTIGSTVKFGNPRAEAIAELGTAIKERNASDARIKRNDATYRSLQKQGKSYGSGFGG